MAARIDRRHADTIVGRLQQVLDRFEYPRVVVHHGDIYAISQMADPPLRTVLGADAYALLEAGYSRSLDTLKAQKDVAASVMFEAKSGFMPG